VLASTTPSFATKIRNFSLSELRERADSIVVATVTSAHSRAGESGMVWTDYSLVVREALKNGKSGDTLTLSFAGGKLDDRDVGIDGVPALIVGNDYVLFVKNEALRPVPIVGWGQGVFEASNNKLVSAEGESLVVNEANELDRAPVVVAKSDAKRLNEPEVRTADGRRVSQQVIRRIASENRAATLADLRRFVRGEMRDAHERKAK
jgi:hypothetical protein